MQKDIEQLGTLSQRLKSQSDIAMQQHGAFISWAQRMRGEIAERTADTVKAVQAHGQSIDDELAGLVQRSKDLQNRLLGNPSVEAEINGGDTEGRAVRQMPAEPLSEEIPEETP